MQEPEKPLNAIAHEFLTGKQCEYDDGKWVAVCKFNPYCGGWDIEDVPQYDTDMTTAWTLVTAMKACDGVSVKTATSNKRGDYCGVYGALPESRRKPGYIVRRMAICYAESMPLAICQAFIEACKPEEK